MKQQNDIESLVSHIRLRAENFYNAHGLCCSEAIMHVLNRGLRGGMNDQSILAVGSGFCGGMGGDDGTCGALTGAITMIGLFLSPHSPNGLSKKEASSAAKELHDRFKERLSSINCNDLTKELRNNRRARLKNCQKITGIGAEISATIILGRRPDLIAQANYEFLAARDTKLKLLTSKFSSYFKRTSAAADSIKIQAEEN